MVTYETDGDDFSTTDEFYDEISRVVVPDAHWGGKLDAFGDILSGGFGTPEEASRSDGRTTSSLRSDFRSSRRSSRSSGSTVRTGVVGGQGGFMLEPELVNRLADVGLAVVLDIY